MPTPTWEALASTTAGSAVKEVTFSTISQAYTDLYIVVTASCDAGTVHDITWRANGDTGNNYAFVRVLGESSGAYTDGNGGANQVNCNQIGADPSITWLQIFNYASTSVYKGSLMKTSATWSGNITVGIGAGTWKNTAAITSVTVREEQGNFDSGAQFTLYGILKA